MLRTTVSRSAPRRVFVLGGYITPFIGKGNPNFVDKHHVDFGKKKNATLEEVIAATVRGTLAETEFTGKESLIDTICIGNYAGELYNQQAHLGAAVVGSLVGADPDKQNPFLFKPAHRAEAACASGGVAVQSVVQAIRAGDAEIGLAIGAEVQTTVKARQGADYLARAAHYATQRSLDDFMFPCLFARRMEACVRSGKFTLKDTAAVAAKAYHNANRNPLAHMHAVKVSLEDASSEEKLFLANPTYKPYLRLTDCSQVSDGGAGLILASEEGLRRHGLSPSDPSLLEVLAVRLATGNLYDDNRTTLTRMPTSHAAAQQALTAAGVTAAQIEVAEVHDCFTPAELLMYEALGLCQEGEGAAYFHSGATTLDGKVPVNTGGGLVAFGHPVGATGIKQVMEVYRQMKGKCGEYQMKHTPAIGVTLNMGGDDKTAISTVLKNI